MAIVRLMAAHPQIFAILNMTEDSFSDGGKYLAPAAAMAQADKLLAGGADVIDLGAASSNVRSIPVSPDLEIARLMSVTWHLKSRGAKVSIDSFAPRTQGWAVAEGVDYINDVRGFPDPAVYSDLAKSSAKLIVMHQVGDFGPGAGAPKPLGAATRPNTDPAHIMGMITDFFHARLAALTAAGIARERIILDPGMGFFLGADPEVSLTVLRRLPELKAAFGLPLFVSVSRKSFLRKLAGRDVSAIGPANLAAELFASLNGADMIRTHDPAALRDGLTLWGLLAKR